MKIIEVILPLFLLLLPSVDAKAPNKASSSLMGGQGKYLLQRASANKKQQHRTSRVLGDIDQSTKQQTHHRFPRSLKKNRFLSARRLHKKKEQAKGVPKQDPSSRQLLSAACESAIDTVNRENPQFRQYNTDILNAIQTNCGSPPCDVDGQDLKGEGVATALIQRCESLDGTPYYEGFTADCSSPSFEFFDVIFLLSCLPNQQCTEADAEDRSGNVEEGFADFLLDDLGYNCTVAHFFAITSTEIDTCFNEQNAAYSDPRYPRLDDVSSTILDAIDTECTTPPCSVDGRILVGDTEFDELVDDCHDLGLDVWIDEFSVLNCDDSNDNFIVKNVFYCLPPSCNLGEDYISNYWDDTEDLQEEFPSCQVTFDFEIDPVDPAFRACDDAYTKLQDENVQFGNFFDQVLEAIDSNCTSPPCDVDGRVLAGDAKFDQLISECRALGADSWVDSYQVDCAGTGYDHSVQNWLDCVPKVCDFAAQLERYVEGSEESLESIYQGEANDPSCNVNFQAQKLGSGGSSSWDSHRAFSVVVGLLVALICVWM